MGADRHLVGDEEAASRSDRPRTIERQDSDSDYLDPDNRLRRFFEGSTIGQAVVGLGGSWLEVNAAFCVLFGFSENDLAGLSFRAVVHPDGLADELEQLDGLIAGKMPSYSVEKNYSRPDGSTVWVALDVSVLRDLSDRPIFLFAQARNITALRRHHEESLKIADEVRAELLSHAVRQAQINEARYQALVDHLPDTIVCVYNREYRITAAEGTGLDSQDFDGSALLGRTVDEVLATRDAGVMRANLDEAFAGRPTHVEMHFTPTGQENLVDVVPLKGQRGDETLEALVVARNITVIKQRERDLAYAETLWRTTFESAPIAIAQLDIDGQVLRGNPALHDLTGYGEIELIGSALVDLFAGQDRERAQEMLKAILTGAPVRHSERCLSRRNGDSRWVDVSVSVVAGADGRPDYLLAQMADTTEEHHQRAHIAAAQARFAALVEYSTDVIAILDQTLTVSYISPACRTVFGLEANRIVGTPLAHRIHPGDANRVAATLRTLLSKRGAVSTFEVRCAHLDGRWRTLEVTAINRLDDPTVEGVVCNCRDVSVRVQTTARLAHQAMHDDLTGLPNRALLLDRLDQALARSDAPSPTSCAVLFLDLDQFKQVNDTLGHAAGDQCLVVLAARLRNVIRPGDSVARFGGDEFVVLAENIGASGVAVDIAERARMAVKTPVQIGSQCVTVSCSIGVATSDRHEPDALLHEADTAMYRSKERGGDRWTLYH